MKRFVLGTFGLFGRGLRNGLVAIGALAFAGGIIAVADYTATQGTGLTFASLVISAKHYAAFVLCDATAGESQCSAVKAGNTAIVADVAQVVADPNVLAAINSSIPAGANYAAQVGVCDASATTTCVNVKAASTPSVATDKAAVVDVRPSCGACITLGPATAANSVPVTTSPPTTQVTNSATGTTAATVATLAAVSSKTNYVCGFTITADATALATGTATLAGTISGSMAYLQTVQAVASGTSDLTKNFNPCIPASAVNTAITITSVAAGTGGNTIANIWGFVQ